VGQRRQQQQSNGVTPDNVDAGGGVVAINGDSGLVNGVGGEDVREIAAKGGLKKQHAKVPQRQLTGMDADTVRLIGQHLREMGFK
jgi:phage protein U